MVQVGGLEPPTSGSTDRRSNQLSYTCTGRSRYGSKECPRGSGLRGLYMAKADPCSQGKLLGACDPAKDFPDLIREGKRFARRSRAKKPGRLARAHKRLRYKV